MIKAVIFDCDGVLFDSHRANTEYFNSILAAAGQPRLDPEQELLAAALAGSQLLEALFGEDKELAERVNRIARNADYTPFFDWMTPAPDLYATLRGLKNTYRLAMATNRGSTVPQVVERFGLGEYIEIAVGVLDVPRPKPFPDMLDKCLDHFALKASEAVYVGDSPSDYESAQAAGLHFVGIGERTGAAVRVETLSQLVYTIAGLADDPG